MDYLQLLKELAEKAGKNIDASGQMVSQQANLAGKQMDNPGYQPSPEEMANQKQYDNSLIGAVSGSVAPINKGAGILGKAAESKNVMNDIYAAAEKAAQEGKVGTGLNMEAVRRAQQAQSRAMDMADRFKQQRQSVGNDTMDRFNKIKQLLGR